MIRPQPQNWAEARAELERGNARYRASRLQRLAEPPDWYRGAVEGQAPFAVILGCADSRVPPGQIFDQGLGDLFVIRVAGNILDDVVIGSIEYAVVALNVPLVVVLGHTGCGAVAATLAGEATEGHLPFIAEAIAPVFEGEPGEFEVTPALIDATVRDNACHVARELGKSEPLIASRCADGRLAVLPAVYELEQGLVSWLPPAAGSAAVS